MYPARIAILMLICSQPVAVPASESPAPELQPAAEAARPKVALVLSGGGARGAAHVGVIRVLEEEGVPIDLVVGTSMGAIIGSMYAAGYPVAVIEDDVRRRDWYAQLTDSVDRRQLPYRRKEEDSRYAQGVELGISASEGLLLPRAVLGGRSIDFMLRRLLDPVDEIHDFNELPIPFRAIATDLADGSMVVLDHGDLVTAVRASAAFPGRYAPVTIDGRTLIDGGIAANLPVEVARALGADIIIAVNVGSPVQDVEEVRDALDIAGQVLAILTERNVYDSRETLGPDDIYIEPDLSEFTSTSIGRMPEIVDVGTAAADALRPRFAALAQRLGRRPAPMGLPVAPKRLIREVRIEGTDGVDPRQVFARIGARPGGPLDGDLVHSDLDRIFSIGDFEQVEYQIQPGDEVGDDLIYRVTEKNWGPYYLRGGLRLENDFSGTGDFAILASVRRSQLTARGGEWRNSVALGLDLALATELYLPMDFSGTWFFAPELRWESSSILIQTGPNAGSEWRDYRSTLAFDLGFTPSSYGEIRLGLEFGNDRVSPRGQTAISRDDRNGRVVLDLQIDRLDDAYLPRDGGYLHIRHDAQRSALGADIPFDRTLVSMLYAFTLGGDVVLVASIEGGSSSGADLPLQDEFELGGLGRLSGLPRGALRGDQYALARLMVHGPMLRSIATGNTPLRWGMSMELGDAWSHTGTFDSRRLIFAGSVFVAVESSLGAMFLGYGFAESGESSLHLVLGRPF